MQTPLPLGSLYAETKQVRAWLHQIITDPWTIRRDGNPNELAKGAPTLVYASLACETYDAKRLTRAIRAHDLLTTLVSGRINVVAPKGHYAIWQTSIQKRYSHLIVVQASGTLSRLKESSIAYLASRTPLTEDTPPPQFYSFIDAMTSIPLSPAWAPWLWARAHQEAWVKLCPGSTDTFQVWRFEPDPDALTTAIQLALAAQQLPVTLPPTPRR